MARISRTRRASAGMCRIATFDWATLIANKDREIARLEAALRKNLDAAGATIFDDRAVMRDPHTVHLLKADKTITAKTVLIATGGRPWMPDDVEGADLAITSNEAFHLKALPKTVMVVGGGYIAVEFAGIFNGLGSQDAAGASRRRDLARLRSRGARAHAPRAAEARDRRASEVARWPRSSAEGGRKRVRLNDGTEHVVDEVMFAVGRRREHRRARARALRRGADGAAGG